ncbi:MAG: hypothetical protein LBU51_01095 [Bacteroidales bacterium]|jgi:hypothetical protein|nr:hypothetical protein [Bacteroidales bacterium]
MMNRKTELNLIVGVNGSGKTTFIDQQIVSNSEKSLVVTPDDMEWKNLPEIPLSEIRTFTGNGKIIYRGPDTIEYIKKNYSGGNLIMDDAMAYLNHQTPDTMRYIYIRRRHFGIDVYIVAHGLRQVPPQCFTFSSWLILFNSVENFRNRKNEIQPELFEKIITAQSRISNNVVNGKPYYYEIILLDTQIRGQYEYDRKNHR